MIVVRTFGPQSLLRAAVIAAALLSPFTATAYASPIQQIATFPRDGADRAAPEAELYFVFDQPTAKSGSFYVADLDSGAVEGTQLTLDAPRWSALGDTVFLKPVITSYSIHYTKLYEEADLQAYFRLTFYEGFRVLVFTARDTSGPE